MKKVIKGSRIEFWNEETNKIIMYIDYSTDECIWYFYNSEVITITKDMDLFELLKNIISQQYKFNEDEILKSYKSDNKLIWYSDCYYNPDDEWSRNSVSYLKIEYIDCVFKLKCTKPLDSMINRKEKSHVIAFSPLGNGKYTKNIKSGLTLQDDFVTMVYQELLKREKVKELH
jgi:hypothetical protein